MTNTIKTNSNNNVDFLLPLTGGMFQAVSIEKTTKGNLTTWALVSGEGHMKRTHGTYFSLSRLMERVVDMGLQPVGDLRKINLSIKMEPVGFLMQQIRGVSEYILTTLLENYRWGSNVYTTSADYENVTKVDAVIILQDKEGNSVPPKQMSSTEVNYDYGVCPTVAKALSVYQILSDYFDTIGQDIESLGNVGEAFVEVGRIIGGLKQKAQVPPAHAVPVETSHAVKAAVTSPGHNPTTTEQVLAAWGAGESQEQDAKTLANYLLYQLGLHTFTKVYLNPDKEVVTAVAKLPERFRTLLGQSVITGVAKTHVDDTYNTAVGTAIALYRVFSQLIHRGYKGFINPPSKVHCEVLDTLYGYITDTYNACPLEK